MCFFPARISLLFYTDHKTICSIQLLFHSFFVQFNHQCTYRVCDESSQSKNTNQQSEISRWSIYVNSDIRIR